MKPGRSISRTLRQAGPFLAVGVLCLTLGTTASSMATAAAQPGASPNPADFSCTVPALPHGVKKASDKSAKLSGPAVTALTGGAVRHGFALDDGSFAVAPPQKGDTPVLRAQQAICGAMASTGDLSATVAGGVAVGYGRVTIASRFFPIHTGVPVSSPLPTVVASFQDRLAWVVVVHRSPPAFSCPLESKPVRLVTLPTDHAYEVFVIDARTGTDALAYFEGGPGGCKSGARVAPSVASVEESVSLPWTLVARDPDGYSGTIAVNVFQCDQVPNSVLVDSTGPNVGVTVTRPFGPPCEPEKTDSISLHAATVTSNLPAVIGHDPVGLTNLLSYRPSTAPNTSPVTTTTETALVPANITTSGLTMQLTVGQVLTVNPLPGSMGGSFVSPAVSSDPAILGPLTSSPQPLVAEFRAWKPGTATITVPQSSCINPESDQLPCSGSYVLYVVVR